MSDPIKFDQDTVNQLQEMLDTTIHVTLNQELQERFPNQAKIDRLNRNAEKIASLLILASAQGFKPVKAVQPKPKTMSEAIRVLANRG